MGGAFKGLLFMLALFFVLDGPPKQPTELSVRPSSSRTWVNGPYLDHSSGDLVVDVGIRPGEDRAEDAQILFRTAMDRLAGAAGGKRQKKLKIAPGHYVFNRPLVFREKYRGIALEGAPQVTRTLTKARLEPGTVKEQIERIRDKMPVIDGDGVSSFMVVDGVTADRPVTTSVAGFYFVNQMAGLGGTHYPDLSYRMQKGATGKHTQPKYSRYVFSDGGVLSVLGNSTVNFENNIIDYPLAYQCGGVLRNEQYGATIPPAASRFADNIIIDPFAWHTGAVVDNASGSRLHIEGNQIFIFRAIPHTVALITNFNEGFITLKKNHFFDRRNDRSLPIVAARSLGAESRVLRSGNSFSGVRKPYENRKEVPPFPTHRELYFFLQKGKWVKLLAAFTRFDDPPFVRPGGWPDAWDSMVHHSIDSPASES